ncbi:Bidirectional sugar transporter SWEET15 [Hondaea fermentalgiana]|uniref:Bidirectional sugar transporter SWEET15 n=1 Tax=Hondaea fermentalgiana TaxID=2315210 RepID=A0A2R5GBJ5_9STRA|nr:Bidirectional sugar transporter SWEET15 [Hondaea fermentalgiana]|eukprot:GBG28362.1 Bidirectional sugar transporter SWEET15 [Hondaea fermentalgiana]
MASFDMDMSGGNADVGGVFGSVPADSALGLFFSVAGPLASISCFLIPMSTVLKIRKANSTGDLPLLPFLCMAVQSMLWLGYGILVKAMPIIVPNLVGVTMGTMYTSIFFSHFVGNMDQLMRQLYIAAGILGSIGVSFLILSPEDNLLLLGFVAASSSVFFAASPLAALLTVFRTRSTESMPFQTSLTLFMNGALWAGYGALVANDPTVYIPNFLGGSAGTIQLLVHAYFATQVSATPTFSPVSQEKDIV